MLKSAACARRSAGEGFVTSSFAIGPKKAVRENRTPTRYQPLGKERFQIDKTVDGEQIKIKAQRQIFPMLFLPFWLAIWTAAGVAVIRQLVGHFEPFLVIWLCGWAIGWVAAAGTLIWIVTGAETIKMVQRDLEVAHQALGFKRAWLYQGDSIRMLGIAPPVGMAIRRRGQIPQRHGCPVKGPGEA